MCKTANQQYIWSHMVVYMVSKKKGVSDKLCDDVLLAVFVIQK